MKFLCLLLLFGFQALLGKENAEKIFSDIYREAKWGRNASGQGWSGPGSTPEECVPLILYLHDFLNTFQIQSIVELGCGDWMFGRQVDWGDRMYLGIDVVPSLITSNQALYGSGKVSFLHLDGTREEIPGGDLLICKDVLQHLSNSDIGRVISQIKKFKYVLFVNKFEAGEANVNIRTGGFHQLDFSKRPFNLVAQQTTNYISGGEIKQIFLIVND
jgi:hypothetical protein